LNAQTGHRRVLFVCTANICRSPTAELLARVRFGEDAMAFRSAGFLGSGRSCPKELVGVLGQNGIDASAHRSYELDADTVAAADILLTMEGSHVQKATMLAAEAFPKTLPLKEASAVVDRAGGGIAIEDLLDRVNADRDPRQYLGSKWDVDDPYGGKSKEYRRAVDEIADLVANVIGRLH
jgi:protein-tyrosine-phosphatase